MSFKSIQEHHHSFSVFSFAKIPALWLFLLWGLYGFLHPYVMGVEGVPISHFCLLLGVGCIFALMVFFSSSPGANLIGWFSRVSRSRRVGIGCILLLIVICSAFFLNRDKDTSTEGRLAVWKNTVELIGRRPLTGYGYGRFEQAYNQARIQRVLTGSASPSELLDTSPVHSARNFFLEHTVEGGIPATLLLLGALSFALLPFFKRNPASETFFGPSSDAPSRCCGSVVSLLLLVFYAVLLVLSLYGVFGQIRLNRALRIPDPAVQADYVQAIEELEKAALYTSSPQVYDLMGLYYMHLGRYYDAALAYQKEVGVAPGLFLPRISLMRAYQQAGYIQLAIMHAKMLLSMLPEVPSAEEKVYSGVASGFLKATQDREALEFSFDDILPVIGIVNREPVQESVLNAPAIDSVSSIPLTWKHRVELERVVAYYLKNGDTLKLQAARFLIANMERQFSENYHWVDAKGSRVPFDELDYPDFETALLQFDRMKTKIRVHPVEDVYRDVDTISSSFLISHIESAFSQWQNNPWAKDLSFGDFCRYVLPYRVFTEPLEPWRELYQKTFSPIVDPARSKSAYEAACLIKDYARSWFTDTWGIESREEPLPMLSPRQILFRKQGSCEDQAELMVYALRSQGIPAAVDCSVFWATSFGGHFWAGIMGQDRPLAMDMSQPEGGPYLFTREPSKVIRYTYAAQSSTLAAHYSAEQIPPGFLRQNGYLDVTHEYWPTANLACALYPDVSEDSLVFSCVFNGGDWKAAYWGIREKQSVIFPNMARGVAYLPMSYQHGGLLPAGDPVILPLEGESFVAHPTFWHRIRITIPEKEKYLIYLPDKRYSLYYYHKGWILLQEQIPGRERELTFSNVPKGALLLLRPEYSQGKERPFTIDANGKLQYW